MKKELFTKICERVAEFLGMELSELVVFLLKMLAKSFPTECESIILKNSKTYLKALKVVSNPEVFSDATRCIIISESGSCSMIDYSESPSDMTFYGLSIGDAWLIREATIPEGTKVIAEDALAYTRIETIDLPDTLEKIERSAFCGSSLKSLKIPSRVTNIEHSMCRFCRELEEVELPEGIKVIPSLCFEGCRALRLVNIPDSVTTIEEGAFAGCNSLPENIKAQILALGGDGAFAPFKTSASNES